MTFKEKLAKYNKQPLVVLVNGLTFLGVKTAEVLIEQEALVIIVDEIGNNLKPPESLESNDLCVFLDTKSLEGLGEILSKLDYLCYFQKESENESLESKTFLENAKLLDASLNLVQDKDARMLLLDSIMISRFIHTTNVFSKPVSKKKSSYSTLELQQYNETLTLEYIDKYNLNAKIIRMGKIFGPGMDMNDKGVLSRMIRESINEDEITVCGEGLFEYNVVYITDAIYGLLKALFDKESKETTFACANEDEITELNIGYCLIDLDNTALELKFETGGEHKEDLERDTTESLTAIGWNPKVGFERGIRQTVDWYRDKTQPKVQKKSKVEPKRKLTESTNLKRAIEPTIEEIEIDTSKQTKNNAESIMDIFGKKYKKPVLDKINKRDKNHYPRLTGLRRKKQNPEIKIKAQKRIESHSVRGKVKATLKVLGFILFILAYLAIISPILKYYSNSFLIKRELLAVQSIESMRDYDELTKALTNSIEACEGQENALALLSKTTFNFFGYEKYQSFREDVSHKKALLEDVAVFVLQNKAIDDYIATVDFKVNKSGNDFSISQSGTYTNPQTRLSLEEASEDFILRKKILEDSKNYQDYKAFVESSSLSELIDNTNEKSYLLKALLGLDASKSNLIVLLNDEYVTPLGGVPIGVVRLDFENGKLETVKINDLKTLTEFIDIEETQSDMKRLGTDYANLDPKLFALSLSEDKESIVDKIKSAYKSYSEISIDNVFLINLSTLDELMKYDSKSEYKPIGNNLSDDILEKGVIDFTEEATMDVLSTKNSEYDNLSLQFVNWIKDGSIHLYISGVDSKSFIVDEEATDKDDQTASNITFATREALTKNVAEKISLRNRYVELQVKPDGEVSGTMLILYDFEDEVQSDLLEYIRIGLDDSFVIESVKGIELVGSKNNKTSAVEGLVSLNPEVNSLEISFKGLKLTKGDYNLVFPKISAVGSENITIKIVNQSEDLKLFSSVLSGKSDDMTYSESMSKDLAVDLQVL